MGQLILCKTEWCHFKAYSAELKKATHWHQMSYSHRCLILTFKMSSCFVNSSKSFPPSSWPSSCLLISAIWSDSLRMSTVIWDDDFGEFARLTLDCTTVYVVRVTSPSLTLASTDIGGYWIMATWLFTSCHFLWRRLISESTMAPAPLSCKGWPCSRSVSRSRWRRFNSSSNAYNGQWDHSDLDDFSVTGARNYLKTLHQLKNYKQNPFQ